MTTTIKKTGKSPVPKKKTGASKTSMPKKPLRVRPELLPDTATYGTFAGKEYLMIPVEDFGEWFEDITLGAIAQDRLENDTEPPIPFEDILTRLDAKGKRKADK